MDEILPFGNEVRFGLINGTTIRLMLDRSVWDIPGGPFLSVQGLRFWYDPAMATICLHSASGAFGSHTLARTSE